MALMSVSRRLSLLAFAALIASCGGGGGSQPLPPPLPSAKPAQPASVANSKAALALMGAATFHAYATTAPFMWYSTGASGVTVAAEATGPCVFNSGSMQASLDGSPTVAGARLPAGNHAYVMTFANCLVDGLAGFTLDGAATAVYSTTDWSVVTAQVSAGPTRVTGNGSDVSVSGSGTWSLAANANTDTETYTPAIGSTVINNLTTNVITFQGGSASNEVDRSGSTPIARRSFNSLAITLNGTSYLLDGTLQSTLNNLPTGSGEVRITSNGVLVARIFYDSQSLRAEAFAPLEVF